MSIIVKINIVVPCKEVPGAIASPFGAPVGFHCGKGERQLLFVLGVTRVTVCVGEGPEDDGDRPDDVTVLGVYRTRLVVGVAEGVVGWGVEGGEGASSKVNAGGEAVEGVVEAAGDWSGILFWMIVLVELAGRSSRYGIGR